MSSSIRMQKEPNPEKAFKQILLCEINKRCQEIERSSFQQEPMYVAALMGKLTGMDIKIGATRLKTTMVNDRGPGSAESKTGADFAIILENYETNVFKAILGQAKGGAIKKLQPAQRKNFDDQCEKMKQYTNYYIALEAPSGNQTPQVHEFNNNPPPLAQIMTLDKYLVDRFLACHHGDNRPDFTSAVKNSGLLQLQFLVS